MIGIVTILIFGILGLFIFVGFHAAGGYDDGAGNYRYSNAGRGLAAWAYDMGYNAADGKDDRLEANRKRNEARRTKKEAKVND